MWDVLAALALLALVVYGFHPVQRWRYRNFPGPRPLWLLGNALDIKYKSLEVAYAEWGQRYGPVFLCWMGSIPTVVVQGPENVREVLVKTSARDWTPNVHMPGSDGERMEGVSLLFTNGEYWRVARNAWQPFFAAESLESYRSLMACSTDKLCSLLGEAADSGRQVDLWREFGRLAMDGVGTCAFGVDFYSLDEPHSGPDEPSAGAAAGKGLAQVESPADRLATAVRTVINNFDFANAGYALFFLFPEAEALIKVALNALALVGAAPSVARGKKAYAALWEVCSELIAATRAQQAAQAKQEQQPAGGPPAGEQGEPARGRLGPVRPGSFLYLMTLAADKAAASRPDLRLDDGWIIAQAINFMAAGYETTSSTLAFCAYLLACNPDKEARLQEELDALANSSGGGGTEAGQGPAAPFASLDLATRAPYLAAVWAEALRLYPPVPVSPRLAKPGLKLGELVVPAGTAVHASLYGMQRSGAHWPDPEAFLPERFLPGAPAALAPPPGAHLPFGGGARRCIGGKFATQEGLLALAAVYSRFTFRLEPGQVPLRVYTRLSLSPADGVHVTVHRRQRPGRG